jgi:hypothetical protein
VLLIGRSNNVLNAGNPKPPRSAAHPRSKENRPSGVGKCLPGAAISHPRAKPNGKQPADLASCTPPRGERSADCRDAPRCRSRSRAETDDGRTVSGWAKTPPVLPYACKSPMPPLVGSEMSTSSNGVDLDT